MDISLWTLAAVFALLGAATLLRRPDLHAARRFSLFAGFGALSLAIGPAANGPKPIWALALQVLVMLPVGPLCLTFASSLSGVSSNIYRRGVALLLVLGGSVILGLYVFSVVSQPSLYEWVRPGLYFYFSISMLAAVALLAVSGNRHQNPVLRQQSRLALTGIALGIAPLVGLTLLPDAVGLDPFLPASLTALAVVVIPALFAYAILQFQFLGIRRLVHRGMVYGIATLVLLIVTSLVLMATLSALEARVDQAVPTALILVIYLAGVLLFYPLRNGARHLVDKMIYHDVLDYQSLMEVVHRDLLAPNQTQEVASGMARMLLDSLQLESVLMFLGDSPGSVSLVVAEGERCEDVLDTQYPELRAKIQEHASSELAELRWQSDSLLLATLALPGAYLGYMLLGPKYSGEVFLEEERQLIRAIIPILALAIDKSQQSQELRELNQQLVRASEAERGRIATDIHDGPLQKAILLASVGGTRLQDPVGMARQLASDLREICSRLRPSILDDLGLAAALEWLMDDVEKRHSISTSLTLDNVHDEERFSPEVELALFRVTQEAANNAIKHAACTSLSVTLSSEEDYLVLQVSDDGAGFSPDSRHSNRGFGLSGMSERVVQLSGSFDIHSAPGVGTTVVARVPRDTARLEDNTNGATAKGTGS